MCVCGGGASQVPHPSLQDRVSCRETHRMTGFTCCPMGAQRKEEEEGEEEDRQEAEDGGEGPGRKVDTGLGLGTRPTAPTAAEWSQAPSPLCPPSLFFLRLPTPRVCILHSLPSLLVSVSLDLHCSYSFLFLPSCSFQGPFLRIAAFPLPLLPL